MGVNIDTVQFLAYCRSEYKVDFSQTITAGRQGLFCKITEAKHMLRKYGISKVDPELDEVCQIGYAEPLLRSLGAREAISCDYSAYEGATVTHDLNLPIGDNLKGRFSAVLDCGTLEHVFNYPQALRNLMDMTQVGGSLILATPANNFCGHGFYQLSPELFFSILRPINGWETRGVFLRTSGVRRAWYKVKDPREIGRRVTFTNSTETIMYVLGRKVRAVNEPIQIQQSDYEELWSTANHRVQSSGSRLLSFVPARFRSSMYSLRSVLSRRGFGVNSFTKTTLGVS